MNCILETGPFSNNLDNLIARCVFPYNLFSENGLLTKVKPKLVHFWLCITELSCRMEVRHFRISIFIGMIFVSHLTNFSYFSVNKNNSENCRTHLEQVKNGLFERDVDGVGHFP
jgi:hypothetical protein